MGENILVAQSGGPTAVINATLSGVLRAGARHGLRVYGGLYGIQGILRGQIIRIDDQLRGEEDYALLEATPAAALGSCRYKMPDPERDPEPALRLAELCRQLSVGSFLYIGGNDSMDTAEKLGRFFASRKEGPRVVGVPKTIDNDLVATDHTPGFGSAAKYVTASVLEVARDAEVYANPSVTIVEIMGRDAGWLTASAALAQDMGGAPQLVYLPEEPFSPDGFIEDVRRVQQRCPTVTVAVSEGIRVGDGDYLQTKEGGVDAFGHRPLAGAGRYLEGLVKERLGCKVRSVELSVLQRAAAHLASGTDVAEAVAVGSEAVELALCGHTAVMAAIRRLSDAPYRSDVAPAPLSQVANHVKPFPSQWVQNHALTAEGKAYFLPLIQGERLPPFAGGLPAHFGFDRSRYAL